MATFGRAHALIHLVTPSGATVSPVCGDWKYATNWTTVAAVVTCPACLAKLENAEPRAGSEAAARKHRP